MQKPRLFAKKQKRDSMQINVPKNETHCKKCDQITRLIARKYQKRDSLHPKNATHLQLKLNRDSFAIVIVAIGACWCWCESDENYNEGTVAWKHFNR